MCYAIEYVSCFSCFITHIHAETLSKAIESFKEEYGEYYEILDAYEE